MILIATMLDDRPDHASVAFGYAVAREQARAMYSTEIVPSEICYPGDVCRTRSVAVNWALQRCGWEWLLFWDSDVVPSDVSIIGRMRERAEADGHKWIGAAYSKKRLPPQLAMKHTDETVREGRARITNDCIEVDLLAIGFTMIHRSALEEMVAHYREELWFSDEQQGQLSEVVALFKLDFTAERRFHGKRFRELSSEDYSACRRWRALGGKIACYVGPGAPLGHLGHYLYRGP